MEEANDCTVKAIALACGVEYEEAHTALKTFGRKHGCGTSISIMKKTARMLGFEMKYIDQDLFIQQYPGCHKNLKSVTTHHPERFNKVWKDGHNYILSCTSHVAAVIDGENCDWTKGRAKRCIVYRVEKIKKD